MIMRNLLPTSRLLQPLAGIGVVLLLAGCRGGGGSKEEATSDKAPAMKQTEYVAVAEYINPEDSLPHLRYFADGLESLNDRCAVRKVRLNPKMPPVYVNGRPVGFC